MTRDQLLALVDRELAAQEAKEAGTVVARDLETLLRARATVLAMPVTMRFTSSFSSSEPLDPAMLELLSS